MLSNSSKRADRTVGSLAPMGFGAELFDGVVTSGELVHRGLRDRKAGSVFAPLGRRVWHVTWARRGTVSLEGLGLQVVDDPGEAEFILVHGVEGVARSEGGVAECEYAELERTLREAAEKRPGVPLVCANPDFETVAGGRATKAMPGALARAYAKAGGENVVLIGKPEPLIYDACLDEAERLGVRDASKICAVGDSLHHDIAGAAGMSLDCLLVTCGLHAGELQQAGVSPEPQAVAELAARMGVPPPTHVCSSLTL